MFQSPQNRGYSSDQPEPARRHLPDRVSIPSESGLFLRSTAAATTTATATVSIPSESGLFLRSQAAAHHKELHHEFQSPQNRGYSSDSLSQEEERERLQLVSIPSESGLFLR